MRLWLMMGLFLVSLSSRVTAQDRVWEHFGSGKAEISSYEVIQPRYGELRRGHEVFIFVPEPFIADKRIKPDNDQTVKPSNLIHVMKLNRYHQFLTGIYPYNVMTTIQAAMYEKAGFKEMSPVKMNIAAIEWCGNYFAEVRPSLSQSIAKWDYFSYFETEGRQIINLPYNASTYFEDNLWIRIRELTGTFLSTGESKEVQLYERLWQNRVNHIPLQPKKTVVKKEVGMYQEKKANKWTWRNTAKTTTVWTGVEYPHYILGWKDSLGGTGKKLATLHLPYWQKKSLKDERIRKQLKL